MDRERRATGVRLAGVAVGVLGSALAVAGTLSLVPWPVGALLVGLVCVAVGLLVVAAGRRLGGRREAGDALVVRVGFGFHLIALLVTLALGGRWLLGGAGGVPVAALGWGAAAVGYATLAYGWDRAVPTDVDAV